MFPRSYRRLESAKADPLPSSSSPIEVALDIYSDFTRVRETYVKTDNICIPFEASADMKEILVSHTNGIPVRFTSSHSEQGHGRQVAVMTKSGAEYVGKQIGMSSNSIDILLNGKVMTIFKPTSITAENINECFLKLSAEDLVSASEFVISYSTSKIFWKSELIATIMSDGSMSVVVFANITNESESYINNTEINLILGNVLRNSYGTPSFAMQARSVPVSESSITDFRIIPIENEPITAMQQRVLIDSFRVREANYKRVYFVDNRSTSIYKGFEVPTPIFLPSSNVQLFQEFGIERNGRMQIEKIFIGSSQIDATQEDSTFKMRSSESTLVDYNFYEEELRDGRTQFVYTVTNKTNGLINIHLDYYFNGRKLEAVLTNHRYTIYPDHITFVDQVPSSIQRNREIEPYDYPIVFRFKNN